MYDVAEGVRGRRILARIAMCLVAFATETEHHHLIVAANRDESFARPASAAAWWSDAPDVFGGRDLEKGGTWLAVTRSGRFVAVTNVRRGGAVAGARSRGDLCASFVRGDDDAESFATVAAADAHLYGRFNLVVWSGGSAAYASSEHPGVRLLGAGVHALSNAAVDTPWPKVVRADAAMNEAVRLPAEHAAEHLFAMLADRAVAQDDMLPETGVGVALERMLSPIFVSGEGYGTRCSTVVEVRRDGKMYVEEWRFGPEGRSLGVTRERWTITASPEASR